MTIKFHYHYIRKGRGGNEYCHVYSDDFTSPDRGRKELEDWMKQKRIPLDWIQEGTLIHLDLWGKMLCLCGKGESSEGLVNDIRRFRAVQGRETDELHTGLPEREGKTGRHK